MNANVYHFNGKNYSFGAGIVHVEDHTPAEDLTGPQLVTLHNLALSNLEKPTGKRVNKFADKATALKRTEAVLVALDAEEDEFAPAGTPTGPADPKPRAKAKAKRKPRGMRFVFRPEDVIKDCVGSIKSVSKDTRTLRQRVLAKLTTKEGGTFEEVVEIVKGFDVDRAVPSKNERRRAYEVIRLLHYYVGYGLKQNGDKIIAYSDPKDA